MNKIVISGKKLQTTDSVVGGLGQPTTNYQLSTINYQLSTKKGFTLIELLIVTVVIVALMGVMFRLTGIAGSANARETTVYRMQCLENCLSGYYAAFGSYPPVPLQGKTRNIFRKTDDDKTSIQSDDPGDVDESDSHFNEYNSVEAACRAQPVAVLYPPPRKFKSSDTESSFDKYKAFQQAVSSALQDGFYSESDQAKIEKWVNAQMMDLSRDVGSLNSYTGTKSANQLQLFRFGLMSFLLPRYRFMLGCAYGSQGANGTEAFNNAIDSFAQWTDNNTLPPRLDSGVSYASWQDFCDVFGSDDDWQIDLIPSQAACARWMPNLRDVVVGPSASFFGTSISPNYGNGIPRVKDAASFGLYYPGGYNRGSGSSGYPLLSYTVQDGWSRDFYYYSPAPYQSYMLWSAGANGKTFPPWVDLEQFRKDHPNKFKTAVGWMADDIKYMSTGK